MRRNIVWVTVRGTVISAALLLTQPEFSALGQSAKIILPTENRALLTGDYASFYQYVKRDFEGEVGDAWEGGQYGFVSSHAANTFALITFLSFFFRRKDFALGMYLWASFICYSRVYAGVHYPFDILGGMFLGIVLGVIGYKTYFHFNKKL